MLKRFFSVLSILYCFVLSAQEISLKETKKIFIKADTVSVFETSINPSFFEIKTKDNQLIDTSFYKIDYKKALLIINTKKYFPKDTLVVNFYKYPDFITRSRSIFDDAKVLPSGSETSSLYKFEKTNSKDFIPFDGLTTSGSITRGITVGNNQNAAINSALDLQISGKLSNKISLRASIQDSNIPIQQGGYSQKLDEFDQVFIELFAEKWSLRAGDLFIENRQSQFLNFNKKVQGISAIHTFGTPKNLTKVFAAAALVRGQYAKSAFIGQEGNQGPYKLRGQNDALFVLIVSGSERVFVNGILLKRGENNEYIIDYNAGEIRFTSLFPITSEMRINVEYQFSDRSFTRFASYAGATHQSKKWSLGGFLYSENDAKNQPLQQSLTEKQVENLVAAGDNNSLMFAPSAFQDDYSNNKILYKKVTLGASEIFQYSNVSTDVLFNVRFSFVGLNTGNYKLANNNAIGKIYEYVAPIGGILQGSYEPITRLTAPTKIAIATVLGKFNPSAKTLIDFEMGVSNSDKNLFSNIDDDNNSGFAGKLNVNQRLFTRKWKVDYFGNFQFIQKEFSPVERLFTIEFNRDWNIIIPTGNQSLLISGIAVNLAEKGFLKYSFEKLNFADNFEGNRHLFNANIRINKLSIQTANSSMKSDASLATSKFYRSQTAAKLNISKNWVGATVNFEDNNELIKPSQQLSKITQKFLEYGSFVGRGDSTKVFMEIGVLKRANDSLQSGLLKRVNQSNSYYIRSKLIQNERSNLSVFSNYRILKFEDRALQKIPSLNSRILFNTRFFGQLIQTNLAYETNSGTIAQQEFTYVEVDAGRGIYTWIDYNGNGIQELQEFEIAQFSDQAKYVRIFLPNQIFVKTDVNKFSQSLIFNPTQWQNKLGAKKIISYFYNQTSFLTDTKVLKNGSNINLNPFSNIQENVLGQNTNFRNSFFYNRGKQKHSVTYNYISNKTKSLLTVGAQKNSVSSNQIQYQHLLSKTWLVQIETQNSRAKSESDNFASRNFELYSTSFTPKISYLFSRMSSLDVFYDFQNKKNNIGQMESLEQQKMGLIFTYSTEKQVTINGDFSFINNNFSGNAITPVAFQMLEGLQIGKNFTWKLLIQKRLTSFLDVNLNYQARKSNNLNVIQTGNLQLRAFF